MSMFICSIKQFDKEYREMQLKDILTRISEITNKSELSPIRELTVGVIGVCNPVAGVAAGTINSVISDYNIYKLTLLLDYSVQIIVNAH